MNAEVSFGAIRCAAACSASNHEALPNTDVQSCIAEYFAAHCSIVAVYGPGESWVHPSLHLCRTVGQGWARPCLSLLVLTCPMHLQGLL